MDDDVNHGLKWSAISVLAVRVLSAVRSLIIARAVGPDSVGAFAAAFAFVALASLLAEFGLQSYLIQRGSEARTDASGVAQLAFMMGGASSIALLCLARPIGSFYGNGDVAGLVVALTASVLLTSLIVVPSALLRADFRFDIVARSAVAAEVAACAVGVIAALRGAGVWALVASALTSQTVTLAVLLAARPQWDRAKSAARSEARRRAFRFGASLATGSAVWTFALQGDNAVVGRVLGASALGLYAFAYNYGVLPAGLVGATVSDVALAGFGREANDQARADLFLKLTRVGAAAACPLVAVAVLTAPAAIRLVLGAEWIAATRPLQILLIVGLVRGLMPTEALLRSKGLVSLELKVGLVAAPATVLAAYLGAQISLAAVATFVGLVLTAAGMVATRIALRAVGLSLGRPIRAIAPALGLSCAFVTPLLASEITHAAPDVVIVALLAPCCLLLVVLALRRWLPDDWQTLSQIAKAGR